MNYIYIINNIIKNFKESNFNKSIIYADEKLELTFALTTTLSQKLYYSKKKFKKLNMKYIILLMKLI